MRKLVALLMLTVAQHSLANVAHMSEDEILEFRQLHESECEPTQTFRSIGGEHAMYYVHIVQEKYKYSSGCRPTVGSVALFKREGDRYRRVWGDSPGEPSLRLRLSVEQHGEYSVLVFDYSDGGNGHIAHQTAYILDDEKVVSLDESAVHGWVEKQLQPEQRNHASSRINYSSEIIQYHTSVMRTGDHRHAKPQTRLLVEAEVAKTDSSYELVVTNAFNIGRSNYFNDQGLAAYHIRDFSAAISMFEDSIAAFPRNWQAHTNLGLAYLKTGEYDSSIDASTVVLNSDQAEDKFKANASFNIAIAYEAGGELVEALRYYRDAYQLSPSEVRRDAISRLENKSAF